jgi:oligoendopeptidase F
MNYQGKPRDVMTLAHESWRAPGAGGCKWSTMARTPLIPTASVFGEMLTFKRLRRLERQRPGAAGRQGREESWCPFALERAIHRAQEGELIMERIGQIWLSV